MSKFRVETIEQYWKQFPNPDTYQIIKSMESVENWTFDNHQELEKMFVQLDQHFDTFKTHSILELDHKETLILMLIRVKIGLALYFLHELDQKYPGIIAELIEYAQDHCHQINDAMSIFLRRCIVFERLLTIKKVFSTERINTIIKILEQ